MTLLYNVTWNGQRMALCRKCTEEVIGYGGTVGRYSSETKCSRCADTKKQKRVKG